MTEVADGIEGVLLTSCIKVQVFGLTSSLNDHVTVYTLHVIRKFRLW